MIGDVFLSFASEHLQLDWKSQHLKQYYMYENFDIRFAHVPLATERNVLVRLCKTLSDLLNRTRKLPRFILVVIDKEFTKMGASTKAYDKMIQWLMVKYYGMIQTCKNQIASKCFCTSKPKFLFMKAALK